MSSRQTIRRQTDPIYRANQDGVGKGLTPVTIRSYGLTWPELQEYLLKVTGLDKLRKSKLLEDKYEVYLPRELSQEERDHIDTMRQSDPRQRRRQAQRLAQRQERDIDEFDLQETEGQQPAAEQN